MENPGQTGQYRSPGGFVFGVTGWSWAEQRPSGITFFLNNTALVADQYGRAIRGTLHNGKEVWFAMLAPKADDPMPGHIMHNGRKLALATHAEVVEALEAERIDWFNLTIAGWPQLAYDDLKKMSAVPHWPFALEHTAVSTPGASCTCVRCCIKDKSLRADALRTREELAAALAKDLVGMED